MMCTMNGFEIFGMKGKGHDYLTAGIIGGDLF